MAKGFFKWLKSLFKKEENVKAEELPKIDWVEAKHDWILNADSGFPIKEEGNFIVVNKQEKTKATSNDKSSQVSESPKDGKKKGGRTPKKTTKKNGARKNTAKPLKKKPTEKKTGKKTVNKKKQ